MDNHLVYFNNYLIISSNESDIMKIAIISVSKKGYELSLSIKDKLDLDSTIIRTDLYHKDVKKYFPYLFEEYDAIIAIMASGILIRSIAHLIESKVTDPAILNIDDNGNFVISTLSGHLGGANKLTQKIADLIDATPVITTSTDVNKKLGIDVMAKDLYLSINDTKEILFFNKSILEDKEIFTFSYESESYSILEGYENYFDIDTENNIITIYQSRKLFCNRLCLF